MLHIGLISLLPEILTGLHHGITGRAIDQNLVKVDCWNLRDWAINQHGQVDDKPYGGGPGMVMLYEPLSRAIQHAKQQMPQNCKVVYLSPQGRSIQQHDLNRVVDTNQSLLFIAGRYEGIDERIIERYVDEEWSIGDFVISGGELAAMVFIDALIRLLPQSLGHKDSAIYESFMNGLLDYPDYTRPAVVDNCAVPAVLLEGNHCKIEQWRRKQSLGKTWLKRADLLQHLPLSDADNALLNEFIKEHDAALASIKIEE